MNPPPRKGRERQGLASPPGLVERDETLALARTALARARDGRGSVILFEGAPGTGRSSLLAAVRESAPDAMTVLTARGRELEQPLELGVLMQLFEPVLGLAPAEVRARLLAAPPGDEFSLLRDVCRLTASLAQPAGVAILIDDAELADLASQRFLLYLAERLDEAPAAIVLASGGASPERDLLGRLGEHPAATRRPIAPLSERGTAHHLRSAWFHDAGRDFCAALHRAACGNPYLVEELARFLHEQGVVPDTAGAREVQLAAPPAIALSALRRAARAGDGAPALLRATAVLHDGAEVRHAADLAGLDTGHALELGALLMQAGLLEESDRLRFAQPVVRSAIAGTDRPSERAAAHLRAARLLMREDAPAERVVGHLLFAPGSGSRPAVAALRDAAASALARGQPGAAVTFLRRALDEPPPRDVRVDVALELGRAEATAGEPEAVARLLSVMERIEDHDRRARTALAAGRTMFALGRHREAAVTLRLGVQEIGDGNERLEGWLRSAYATVSRLDRHAGGLDDGAAPAKAPMLALRALEAAVSGEPRDLVMDLAGRALAGGDLLEEETADGISFYVATAALILAEALAEAEAGLTAALADARSRGSVLGVATASWLRSMAALRRGGLDDAAADAQEAIAAERQGWRLAIPAARAVVAETLMERGDLEAAAKQLDLAELAGPELHSGALGLMAARGRLQLLGWTADLALDEFLACGSALEAIGAANPALCGWRSGAARASAALGDSGMALQLAEEELALAEAFGAPGPVGRALRTLGILSHGAASLDALEAAVTTLDGSEARLEAAEALVDFGAALRRTGRRRAAREPLRRGLDLAAHCGATALSDRALREIRAAGARPRRTAVRGLESLTARERQVATLAAEGRSNREIAEMLYVTVKTVEWHLHHSFEKLEVRSRRELAKLIEAEPTESAEPGGPVADHM